MNTSAFIHPNTGLVKQSKSIAMESNSCFVRFYFGACAAMAIVIMFELLGTIRKINRKLDNDFKRDSIIYHLPQNVKLDSFVKPKQDESKRKATTSQVKRSA